MEFDVLDVYEEDPNDRACGGGEDVWDKDLFDFDSDSDSNSYIAEKSEWQKKRDETMDHFKYSSRRFGRVLRGEPKTERDIREDEARKFFAILSDRGLALEDDLITTRIRNRDMATIWYNWLLPGNNKIEVDFE